MGNKAGKRKAGTPRPTDGENQSSYEDVQLAGNRTSTAYTDLQHSVYAEVADTTRKCLYVAAMDFGTSSSGYALSVYDEYRKDPLCIHSFGWPSKSDGYIHHKTLSAVLLNPEGKFHSFGYDAEWNFTNLEAEEHSKWYYFQNFKMKLFYDKNISRCTEIYDVNGKLKPAMEIFAYSIQFLRNHLLSKVREQVADVEDKDIYWVLTVPAIWSDKAKQFMREAAEKAGIESTSLSIALEPEAAALYCRHLPISKQMIQNSNAKFGTFSPGSQYLVVDLGGGTVDITAHGIQSNGALEELIAATGGNWGSNYVNKEFRKYFESVTVKGILDEMRTLFPDDYILFMASFENKKRVFSATDDRVYISFPGTLLELLEKRLGMSINVHFENKEITHEIKRVRDKIFLSGDNFKKLLRSTIDKIILNIMGILAKNDSTLKIRTLILVGGFAECPVLKEAVKSSFPHLRIIIPNEPVLAVLKGAVLFGRNPRVLTARVSRFTYGICTNRNFIDDIHPLHKLVFSGDRKIVKDIFNPHVLSKQVVRVGEHLGSKEYCTTHKEQTELLLKVYATESENPIFVTDEGMQCLGNLCVQVRSKNSSPKFNVRFALDGTELEVVVIEEGTDQRISAKFDFLG